MAKDVYCYYSTFLHIPVYMYTASPAIRLGMSECVQEYTNLSITSHSTLNNAHSKHKAVQHIQKTQLAKYSS